MKSYDVVILTEAQYINPKKIDWYIENVLTEDRLIQEALENKGLRVIKKDWADTNFDWSTTKLVLFRTTWDYYNRYEEFSKWLKSSTNQTIHINSSSIIKWNMDKKYLKVLEEEGVNIPETEFITKGSKTTLEEIHSKNNWYKTVLKPTFSGGGRHTYKLNLESLSTHEDLFQELVMKEDMMLQVFQNNIVEKGEMSLIMIDGEYTHSVLKVAKEGDFRVQDDFGGSVHEYKPSSEEIDFAKKTIAACPEKPIYARVDIFLDNNNKLALGELELIEPELWFRNNHNAADKLADSIYNQYFCTNN